MRLDATDRLPVGGSTRFRDYILTAYEPRCDPRGRLHAASLLRHLLREAGLLERAWPICAALRAHLGDDETVWGVKYAGAATSLELYFYNFDENAPGNPKSVSALSRALAPWLCFDSAIDETQKYFMCSFELDAGALASGRGGHFRIYCGSGDRDRKGCGFSYRLEGSAPVLENHYWFYRADRAAELADAIRRLEASPRVRRRRWRKRLLPQELRDCFTICYAVKPRSDALYFSRVATAQLGAFLAAQRRERPARLVELLEHHADDLAHLSWDVGFDFDAEAGDGPVLHKLGIHGVL
jgi:hypothetical protein